MILTPAVEARLISCCNQPLQDVIKIALLSGMRLSEILGLRWEWFDMGDNVIKLPAKSMKSKRPHIIPVSRELRALLLRRRLKTKDSPYVFPSNKALSGHLENPHKAWYKAIEKAKIKNLRFHDLRHTFASRLADNGVKITDIQALLGHSDIRITGRYISNSKDRLRQAVESISSNKATEHLRNY